MGFELAWRAGLLTCQGEQLVADKDGRLVLMLVQSILPPITQELLHVLSSIWPGTRVGSKKKMVATNIITDCRVSYYPGLPKKSSKVCFVILNAGLKHANFAVKW